MTEAGEQLPSPSSSRLLMIAARTMPNNRRTNGSDVRGANRLCRGCSLGRWVAELIYHPRPGIRHLLSGTPLWLPPVESQPVYLAAMSVGAATRPPRATKPTRQTRPHPVSVQTYLVSLIRNHPTRPRTRIPGICEHRTLDNMGNVRIS